MKSLYELCIDTLSKSNKNNQGTDQNSLTQLQSLLETLSKTEEIRIFVGGSVNYGHQSTSVVIMNRLISLGAKRIRIVYHKSTNPNIKDDETDVKLTRLIPNLTIANINNPQGFSCIVAQKTATIFFSKYEDFNANAGMVTLGISGGFDGTFNISDKLMVKCLLVLQPFRYEKHAAKNILYFNQKLFPSNNEVALPPTFLEKGFYIEDPPVPTEYFNTPPSEATENWKAYTVKAISDLLKTETIEMCPVYFSEGRSSSHSTTVLFNLLTGLLSDKSSRNKKPIVLLVMSNFRPDIYIVLSRIISGEEEYWEDNPQGKTAKSIREWSPFLSTGAHKYLKEKNYFDNDNNNGKFSGVFLVTLNNDEQIKKLPEFVDEKDSKYPYKSNNILTMLDGAGQGNVFIVDLNRVPKAVFEYIYSIGTLPGIFEGEATASVMLNLGKPYFNLESNDREAKEYDHDLYPYPVIPSEELYPRELSQYCSNFAFNFGDLVWQLHVSTQGFVRTPDEVIAEFINLAYDKTFNLGIYFQSLRSFFHDQNEDKLVRALFFALPEMKDKKII